MLLIKRVNYDKLGIFTSIACTIHCTILPLLINALPYLGLSFGDDKLIEYGMIFSSFIFGVLSLWHGFRFHHHKSLPLTLFSIGFICLLLNQFTNERLIYFFIPASATGIIKAHILNIKYRNKKHSVDVKK